jgi:3-deoxy-7-phosphoheptulonate synthase
MTQIILIKMKTLKKLPTAIELEQAFPLSEEGRARVKQDQEEVKSILAGRDNRLLVIVGPCSAWPFEAALEFGDRLVALQEKVSDKMKIVMRVYCQKPRTNKGWMGPLNQPDPFAAPDIAAGSLYARELMVSLIEKGLAIADEGVFTHQSKGLSDLLSWMAIGARSSEDQEHRVYASAQECAVGLKNPTSGSMKTAVNSVIAAQSSHVLALNGYQVESPGNAYAHLILRGGESGPNFSLESLLSAQMQMEKIGLKHPTALVDCSHENSRVDGKKDPMRQVEVAREVASARNKFAPVRHFVRGIMLESFLKSGSQKLGEHDEYTIDRAGLSITDPCMDFESMEELLMNLED